MIIAATPFPAMIDPLPADTPLSSIMGDTAPSDFARLLPVDLQAGESPMPVALSPAEGVSALSGDRPPEPTEATEAAEGASRTEQIAALLALLQPIAASWPQPAPPTPTVAEQAAAPNGAQIVRTPPTGAIPSPNSAAPTALPQDAAPAAPDPMPVAPHPQGDQMQPAAQMMDMVFSLAMPESTPSTGRRDDHTTLINFDFLKREASSPGQQLTAMPSVSTVLGGKNVATATEMMPSPGAVIQQLTNALPRLRRDGEATTLTLDPARLGRVTLSWLNAEGAAPALRIVASEPATAQLLAGMREQITMLVHQGNSAVPERAAENRLDVRIDVLSEQRASPGERRSGGEPMAGGQSFGQAQQGSTQQQNGPSAQRRTRPAVNHVAATAPEAADTRGAGARLA